jgi:RNA polymerase sigma-70 factor (ECF subfamily)
MDRYARGDQAAFSELYDLLAPRLWRFASNLSRHQATAEDVVQQTFLQLHRTRDRWIQGANVCPWAYAIAHHFFLDSLRSTQKEVPGHDASTGAGEPAAPGVAADDAIDGRRRLAALRQQLERLPEKLRLAVHLVEVEGLSIAGAAEVLGITPNNVKQRVFRARRLLEQLLGDDP